MVLTMFTLAHISDIHLGPMPDMSILELLSKRITGYVNWRRNRRKQLFGDTLELLLRDLRRHAPDHLAVTGDLVNLATDIEIKAAGIWLNSLSKPNDVSVVPGNHDAYVPQAFRYAPQWAPYMSGDDGAVGFPYVRKRGPLALIGLSTGVSTAPFMATGRLGEAQIKALGPLLDALKTEGLFRVILIHHPPVTQAKSHKRLLDAWALVETIAGHGAELLLHGHDHLRMLNWLDGPAGSHVPAVGVPSASAAPGTSHDAAAYNLYAIDGGPGAWRCELVSRGIGEDGTIAERARTTLAA